MFVQLLWCYYVAMHTQSIIHSKKIDNMLTLFSRKDIQITFSLCINNIFRLNSFLKLSKFKIVNTEYLRKQAFNLRRYILVQWKDLVVSSSLEQLKGALFMFFYNFLLTCLLLYVGCIVNNRCCHGIISHMVSISYAIVYCVPSWFLLD